MTSVLVLGATGRSGAAVIAELPPSVRVVAALRSPRDATRPPTVPAPVEAVVLDLTDPTSVRAAARGIDVVVNAVRLREDIPPAALVDLHESLRSAAPNDPGIVTVGGAGSLHLPDGTRFWRHPSFPPPTLPRGIAHAQLRDHLESGAAGAGWVYLIPPPTFVPDGPRLGDFRLERPSADEYTFAATGAVSYADFATAIARCVTEGWKGTHLVGAEKSTRDRGPVEGPSGTTVRRARRLPASPAGGTPGRPRSRNRNRRRG